MSQEIQVNAGADQPLPNDAVQGVAEHGAACPMHGGCWVRRTVRGLTALLVLGSAAAYGAVSINPELANYAWFVPETATSGGHCSASAGGCSSGCPLEAARAMLTSGEVEPGCCSMSKGGSCPLSQPAAESTEAVAAAGVEKGQEEAAPAVTTETEVVPAADAPSTEPATSEAPAVTTEAPAAATEAAPVDVQPKTDLPGAEAEEKTAPETTEEKPAEAAPVVE
jgi:hypothetical protein